MTDSDGNDEKRHYNCIIWPDNHGSNEKKCAIHAYERKVLHGRRDMSSRLQAWPNQEYPQYVALFFFTVDPPKMGVDEFTGRRVVNVEYTIHQKYGQRWDKGGCYLDPQLVEGLLPWE